ncbi:MAG: hypothetical protein IJW51_08920 [Clostridia bacterium]|nr:hypothetical protein [Clostridia bacterium]
MEDKREEKREARDIKFGAPAEGKPPREHGKLYCWLDNFWYHHKWAVIAALAVVLILTVCIAQMCSREEEGDITLITAGPYGFTANEAGLRDLKNCLATYLPKDYNGNGQKDVTLRSYTVYSETEIKELEGRVDENGEPLGISINRSQNSQSYSSFTQYVTTGDAAVMLVSPWLAEQYAANSSLLVDFTELMGETPVGGMTYTREDGSAFIYGVKLSQTRLWQENSAVRNNLPEDTVICLLRPGLIGNNSDEARYQNAVEFAKKIIQ